MTRYIFVTGGSYLHWEKGSLPPLSGVVAQGARSESVTMIKLDPYINLDPGTMSPFQHVVYVTEDGAETDLDLGHYERFVGIRASRMSNFTAGRIYQNVIAASAKDNIWAPRCK